MKDIKTDKQSVMEEITGPYLKTRPVRALPKIFSNPFYVIVVTVISLFLAELFVMFVLSTLPALPLYERALIDALLLVTVAFPAFYLFLFKPIRSCIAEYRQTEESLLKERNFSEMVINSLPGVFYLFDHEGEPREWNRNAETITGYSAEEIKRMKPVDFFDEDDKKLITEKIREVFDKGESFVEADLLSKSGRKTRYYFNGHRLTINGEQYLAGMGVDITGLKKAEEELRKAHREWENIFQAIGHPTVILDSERNILSANKATVTATGLPLEEVVGKKCYEIFHGTGRPPDGCPLEKMLHSGKLETEVMEIEVLDGVYLVSCTPVLDDEGRLQKIIHIAADITELKRVEHILNIQHDLVLDLSGTRDLKEAMSLLLDTATTLEGMDCGGIYTFNPVSASLDLAVSKGLSPEFTEGVLHYSRDSDNVRLVTKGKPVYIDYSKLEIHITDVERREGLLSIAIIPIIYRDQLVACMNIASHTHKGIPFITMNAMEAIASQVGSVVARLKAEEALQKSHSLLTSLVESPSDIIILSVDKNYNYTFFNTAHKEEMKKVWGVDIEIGGNIIGYMLSEEERDKVRNNFEHVLNGESFTKTEWYGEPGNRFWYELAYNPIFDESNNVNGITVFITDITERRQTEEAVLNIATGVSATVGKRFFYSIAEHLAKILKSDYAYVAEIIKEVPNTVRTLALYADGKFIDNIKVDLADTPCETVKEKLSSYPSGVQKLFPRAIMMARLNVEGYIGTPLFGSNGEWLGLMSVMYRKPIENVSVAKSMLQIFATRVAAELERRQSEEELKKANKEIEAWNRELERRVEEKTKELVSSQAQLIQAEKLSAMGRMAGGLAHELNSPLAGLLPLIEKYHRKAKKGSEAYTELSLMFKAAEHMAKIIKDFGAFSRESMYL
jgi:PAS domain S-box-containing protein